MHSFEADQISVHGLEEVTCVAATAVLSFEILYRCILEEGRRNICGPFRRELVSLLGLRARRAASVAACPRAKYCPSSRPGSWALRHRTRADHSTVYASPTLAQPRRLLIGSSTANDVTRGKTVCASSSGCARGVKSSVADAGTGESNHTSRKRARRGRALER